MAIHYRKLELADAEWSVVLRKAMLLDSPASFGSSPADDLGSDLERVRERLAGHTGQATIGAFDDDAGLIGSVGIACPTRPKERHKASVWGMYVAPEFRRQGVGRRLMQEAIAFAQVQDGVSQVQLSVSASAPGAQRLYESLGFVVWGAEPDALRVDGRSYDEHHLSLDLASAIAPWLKAAAQAAPPRAAPGS